jgi:uncharacterized membrane protein
MRVIFLLVMVAGIAGCTANAKLAAKSEGIFRLHNQQVVERDLTMPQAGF